ncbi:MAG: ATP-dependent Clp protease proteolytic subunit [Muribaculaceae bacterium]|nr:ATP-dependent Clp protease proteolytic subunit [Muribaculaceae bacterium]
MAKPNYHLHLKGYVGGWDFDSDYVDYILQKYKDEHVNVLIDSTGGLVGTALSIAAAFRRHGNVSVHLVGLNASAATIASLGAKHISIDKAAMYLVHKCSSYFFKWAQLNADQFDDLIKDLTKTKENLDKFDLNASRQYAARCKRKPEDMLDLMAKEQWLTAEEALEWGFVDEITALEDEKAPQLTEGLVNAMAAAGMPLPPLPSIKELKDEKQSGLMSILKALSSLFKGNEKVGAEVSENLKINNNSSISMEKTLTLLCALLAVNAFKLEDGKTSITEQQLDSIEAALSEKDSKISQQTKEIEDLKKQNQDLQAKLDKKPGAETSQVTEDSKGSKEEKSDVDNYVDDWNNAKAAYDMLP